MWDDTMMKIIEFLMLKIIIPITVIGMVLMLFVLPYEMYQAYTRETFELKKDEWTCTKSHIERHCYKGCYNDDICTEWNRK